MNNASQGSIINCDLIFKDLNEKQIEMRRWLVGKYITEQIYSTNLTKSIYIYNGESICHHKFNFDINGPKCYLCNSFSFLFEDGEIIPNKEIKIETGIHKDEQITIQKFKKPSISSIQFGTYEPDNIVLNPYISTIENNITKQRMINKSCDISHDLAISSLINTLSGIPFKSNTIGGWICDDINLIKTSPSYGQFKNIKFNEKLVKETFINFFILSVSDFFSHGSPDTNTFSLTNSKTSYEFSKDKKIILNSTLTFDVGIYSSFEIDYEKKRLFFVGSHSKQIEEPNWNIKYNFVNGENSVSSQVSKNPTISNLSLKRIATFKPTHEIMNFIRFSGINVFTQMYLFIYITIMFLNSSFYEEFIKSVYSDKLKLIFLPNEYDRFILTIKKYQNQNLNSDQIIDILIESDVSIRIDCSKLLYKLISNFI
jgi:hypothetical protein